MIYSYDGLGRLSTATTTGSTGPNGYAQWGLRWVYDRYGNRVSQNQTAGSPPMNSLSFATTPVPPTYPPGGAYTNRPDGYSFDVSGNMLNDGANNLTYDAENCLISAGTTTYTCDSHGIRVQKALQGGPITVYIFSGGKDIAEYDYTSGSPSPGSPSREYLYLGGQLAATMQGTTVTYHHGDHLSVRLSTGGLSNSPNYGQTVGEQGHYPYGEQWYATNTTTKFFFTSYERDPETGNDYAMARFYINRFGRFSCVDPSMGSPSDPQSWNRYAYARNNPINITDPSGQFWLFKLLGFFLAFIGVLLEPVSAGASSALISLGMNLAGVGFATPSHFGSVPGTPPTFPDPLGNTQATLNSIYSPVNDPNLIIQNFASVSSSVPVDLSALGPCVRGLFNVGLESFTASQPGKAGSFTGIKAGIYTGVHSPDASGPFEFSVANDVSQTKGTLNMMDRMLNPDQFRPGQQVEGFTSDKNPFKNYTGSDIDPSNFLPRQIKELGNSLGIITHTAPSKINENPGPENNEPGTRLLDCYNSLAFHPMVRF